MKAWRIILATVGILLLLYGIVRLLINIPNQELLWVALWLVAALIIHDALIAPGVVGVGWLLRRFLPDRARRFVQTGLIAAAAVTVIAIPMIIREGSQPPQKTLLIQNYAANLALLLGIIAGVTLAAYAVRVARDRSRPASSPAPTDPAPDHPA
jgi:uncharacterized PurR-regulated membrane protein YhhQ (DUF165 family)